MPQFKSLLEAEAKEHIKALAWDDPELDRPAYIIRKRTHMLEFSSTSVLVAPYPPGRRWSRGEDWPRRCEARR